MPDHYFLPCSCGQKIRVGPAQAGDQVTCTCGKSLSVPTLRGIRQLELAPPESATKAASTWTLAHGIAFSSGLFIAAVSIYFLASFGLKYAQLGASGYTRDITDFAVKAESERIAKLTPIAALAEWNQTLSEGLGQPQQPPWVAANKLLASYKLSIVISLIALLVGSLLTATSLLLSRRPLA